MRSLLVWLAGVVPACGAASMDAIGVYMDFERQPPLVVVNAIQREVQFSLEPAGLRFAWRCWPGAPQNEAFTRIVTIQFRGGCTLTDAAPRSKERTLGATDVTDGVVQPFSRVNCNNIHRALMAHLRTMSQADREMAFGRAIGRVVSHELFHIFASTVQHGSTGMGKASWAARELITPEFRFDEREYLKLRKAALPLLLELAGSSDKIASPDLLAFVERGCSGCHGAKGQGTDWGPQLRKPGKSYDADSLSARLTSTRTEMYRRVRQFHIGWAAFAEDDIRELAKFLDTDGE